MTRKSVAILLIGLGILVVLLAVGLAIYQGRINQVTAVTLPEEIAGLTLGRRLVGQQALNELSWMHGQEFELNQGAVGKYGFGEDVTLYVAGTPFGFMTRAMITAMQDKIAREESLFTPLGERDDGSRTVYELEEMGQQHYYFRSGNLVIWVAVDEPQAEVVLVEALNFYP
jgi:hypothetical protein